MKYLLTLLALVLSMSVIAAPSKSFTFEVDGMTFVLYQTKCSDKKVLEIIKELGGVKPEVKLFNGSVKDAKDGLVKMCYAVNPKDPTNIFVVDALGNMGELMVPTVKKTPGA